MVRAVLGALPLGAAVCAVVPRRHAQRRLQLRRPSRRGGPRGSGGIPLGRRTCRRPARDHVRAAAAGRGENGKRAPAAGSAEGHRRCNLHGHGARAAGGNARVHASRSPPHSGIRGLLGRLAVGSHQRHGLRGADHAGRGVAPRRACAAEADGRRGDVRVARHLRVPRRPSHGRRGRDDGGPGHLVSRARGVGRSRLGAVRADGQRRPAVSDVHLRHDCQAQGHRAHDGGLPCGRLGDARRDLRPQARDRRVLVRRRHRLDHRAQLHRVRAALQCGHVRALRGHAGFPELGALVGDRRALRRLDPLHRPDRDPRAHEVGARARGQARPVVPAATRQRRGADQSRGVDVVSRAHRGRALPHRRHVVADRDRHGADHTAYRA